MAKELSKHLPDLLDKDRTWVLEHTWVTQYGAAVLKREIHNHVFSVLPQEGQPVTLDEAATRVGTFFVILGNNAVSRGIRKHECFGK